MKNFKYLFLLFFSLIFLVQNFNAKSSTATQIEVYNQKVKNLPSSHNFVGINMLDEAEVNRNFLTNPRQLDEFGKTLNDLNIDVIRYPGGLNVTFSFWDVPNKFVLEAMRKLPAWEQGWLARKTFVPEDKFDFFKFLGFCQKNKIKSIMQVNTHNYFDKANNSIIFLKSYEYDSTGKRNWKTGKPDWNMIEKAAKYAGQQVKWVKDNGFSNSVAYWELGNEDYAWVNLNSGYTAKEYAKVAALFIKEMKSADPSIKIILTNNIPKLASKEDLAKPFVDWRTSLTKWNIDLLNNPTLKQFKNHIFGISNHTYRNKPVEVERNFSFEDYKKNVLSTNYDVRNVLDYHFNILKETGYSDKKIFINEFSSVSCQNKFAHTWLSALTAGKIAMSLASSPHCYHSDYHNLMHYFKGVDQGFGIIHYAKDFSNKRFIPFPTAYVLSLLNKNLHGSIVKSKFNSSEVFVTSAIENNKLKVIILNIEDSHNINLKLNGFKNLKYLGNKSLGVNIPDNFSVMNAGDSMTRPSEVRSLNELTNEIKVEKKDKNFKIFLPKNTVSVFTFHFT